jgi:carbamoyl-phosphate synthase large subunit
MKSVGEVMAVGRTFEESFQKAIRMLDIGNDGLVLNRLNGKTFTEEEIEYKLSHHDDQILYHVAIALKMKVSVKRIYELSTIDPWFIEKSRTL